MPRSRSSADYLSERFGPASASPAGSSLPQLNQKDDSKMYQARRVLRRVLPLISLTVVACGGDDFAAPDVDPAATSAAPHAADSHLQVSAQEQPLLEQAALVAPHLKPAERIVHVRRYVLRSLGKAVLAFKIFDPQRRTTREIALDEGTGSATALTMDLKENLHAHKAALRASLPRSLALAAAANGGDLRVLLRLQRGVTSEEVADTLLAIQELGATVHGSGARLVTVSATADQLLQLAKLPAIDWIEEDRRRVLALDMAVDLGQQPTLVTWAMPHLLTTAVIEPGACVRRDHPDFSQIGWKPRVGGATCDVGANFGHSTKVAGVLAAYRGTQTAQLAGVWSTNLFDADASQLEAALDLKPHLVNLSYTVSLLEADVLDEAVYVDRAFIVNGAGNDPTDENNCYAYNALCVGGYSASGTPGAFEDDKVVGYSHLNDDFSGREEPKVVGPWTAARTAWATGMGYVSDQGTSYATPAVAGLAGQLITAQWLKLWKQPTLVRAALMTSAVAHPILRDAYGAELPTHLRFDDGVDDRAGVGVPNGDLALAIVKNNQYRGYAGFRPSYQGQVAQIAVAKPSHLRVVLTWDQCPSASRAQVLKADMDLAVYGPNDAVFTNFSSVDNYEVIDAQVAPGTYQVYVTSSRWDVCPLDDGEQRVPLAVAWATL